MQDPLLVPELREYIANNNTEALRAFCEKTPPAVAADYLAAFAAPDVWRAIRNVPPEIGAEIFTYLDDEVQLEMTVTIRRDELSKLVAEMSADDRVDLLKRIPEERREAILPALARAEREDIRRLSSYPEGTAGAVMTSDYVTLAPELSVADALAHLRLAAPDKETIYYAYVVDDSRRLIGFVSLKDLILARPAARIETIMHTGAIFARVDDDQEEAADKIQKYDLIALPVVNDSDVLVGIITHDDALDVITQEHTEDLEKLMAIGGAHAAGVYVRTPAWVHFKNRVGWVVALALLGLVSGFIVQHFEGMLMEFAVLAAFMPMLADTGGNTGSQSATLVIRALALKELSASSMRDVVRVLWKEFQVALPLGLLLAVLAGGRVLFQAGGASAAPPVSVAALGLAVGLALGLQVITATLIGALLPLAVARCNLDPAVVASPALTTVVDITGLLIYFGTVKLLLGL